MHLTEFGMQRCIGGICAFLPVKKGPVTVVAQLNILCPLCGDPKIVFLVEILLPSEENIFLFEEFHVVPFEGCCHKSVDQRMYWICGIDLKRKASAFGDDRPFPVRFSRTPPCEESVAEQIPCKRISDLGRNGP